MNLAFYRAQREQILERIETGTVIDLVGYHDKIDALTNEPGLKPEELVQMFADLDLIRHKLAPPRTQEQQERAAADCAKRQEELAPLLAHFRGEASLTAELDPLLAGHGRQPWVNP